MSGGRKYPYRMYPATPAKQSETNYWIGLILLFVVTVGVMVGVSHLFIR